jgi:acetyl-CoA carboxylase biotin carboxyl carrier protein
MNLKEVKELIELVSEKGFAEFEIEHQGFRLHISRFKEAATPVIQPAATPVIISSALPPIPAPPREAATAPPAPAPPQPASAAETALAEAALADAQLHTIKSPIVGTFYRAASPTSDAFIKVGDHVEPDTVVCIIEAMKLMNEIQAEVSGTVVKTYVQDGQPVEYGQPLFGIKI